MNNKHWHLTTEAEKEALEKERKRRDREKRTDYFQCSKWAVFTPADVMIQSSVAFSRKDAIAKVKKENETWADMKKRGWYSAQITISWSKLNSK